MYVEMTAEMGMGFMGSSHEGSQRDVRRMDPDLLVAFAKAKAFVQSKRAQCADQRLRWPEEPPESDHRIKLWSHHRPWEVSSSQ